MYAGRTDFFDCTLVTSDGQHALKKAEERGLQGDEAAQAAFEENVAAGH